MRYLILLLIAPISLLGQADWKSSFDFLIPLSIQIEDYYSDDITHYYSVKNDKWGLVDTTGTIIIPNEFDFPGVIYEEYNDYEDLYNWEDKERLEKISAEIQSINIEVDSIQKFVKNDIEYLYNITGTKISPDSAYSIEPFYDFEYSSDLFICQGDFSNGNFKIINTKGKNILNRTLRFVPQGQENNIIAILENDSLQFITPQGQDINLDSAAFNYYLSKIEINKLDNDTFTNILGHYLYGTSDITSYKIATWKNSFTQDISINRYGCVMHPIIYEIKKQYNNEYDLYYYGDQSEAWTEYEVIKVGKNLFELISSDCGGDCYNTYSLFEFKKYKIREITEEMIFLNSDSIQKVLFKLFTQSPNNYNAPDFATNTDEFKWDSEDIEMIKRRQFNNDQISFNNYGIIVWVNSNGLYNENWEAIFFTYKDLKKHLKKNSPIAKLIKGSHKRYKKALKEQYLENHK